MASAKKSATKRAKRQRPPRRPPRKAPTRARAAHRPTAGRAPARGADAPASAAGRRLDEIAEVLGIMVPELAARVAAVEHVLVEHKICRRDDLRHARAFIDLKRGG